MGFDRRVVGVLPVAAVAGALGAALLLGGSNLPVTAQDTAKITPGQYNVATAMEGAFMKIADTVGPATVQITSQIMPTKRQGAFAPDENGGGFPFGDLFPPSVRGMPRVPRYGRAMGSGVIVRADGYVLTNDHVVAGAENGLVWVTLKDGRKLRGKVTRDLRSDLAVVKIDAGTPLPYVRIGDSDKLHVGQWAVAIGAPFGEDQTMTAGIVSALARSATIGGGEDTRYYPNLIQTDASINPGNSGGPLLNIKGELIGINVAIESPTGTNAGIGFAIPANTAKSIMGQLITRGKVVRGYLGFLPSDIPAGLRDRLGTDKGAYVEEIEPNTPAENAGIRAGDVITRFGDKAITNQIALRDAIAAATPGSRVSMTLLHDGQSRTVNVLVGTVPEKTAAVAPVETRPAGKLGIEVQTLAPETARELKLEGSIKGVLVGGVEPGSPASEGGLSPHDIITAVNGKPIATVEALNRAVGAAKSGDLVTLTVLRFTGNQAKPSEAVVNITMP